MKRATIVLLLFVAVACGDSGDSGIASLEGSEAAATSTIAPDADSALLEFTQCLREQGIDIDDPVPDVDGNLQFSPQDLDGDPDALLDARDACSDYLAGISLEAFGFDRTALEDQLYAYATCMRENGFDLPDPDLDNTLRRILGQGEQNPGGISGIGPFGDVDFEDPAFIAANEICQPEAFAGFGPPGN